MFAGDRDFAVKSKGSTFMPDEDGVNWQTEMLGENMGDDIFYTSTQFALMQGGRGGAKAWRSAKRREAGSGYYSSSNAADDADFFQDGDQQYGDDVEFLYEDSAGLSDFEEGAAGQHGMAPKSASSRGGRPRSSTLTPPKPPLVALTEDEPVGFDPGGGAVAPGTAGQPQAKVRIKPPGVKLENENFMTADCFHPGDFLISSAGSGPGSGGFYKVQEGASVMPTVPGFFIEISNGRNVYSEVGKRLCDAVEGKKRIVQYQPGARPSGDDAASSGNGKPEVLANGAIVVAKEKLSMLKVGYTNAVLEYKNGRFQFSTEGEILQMINQFPRVENYKTFTQARRDIEPGCILYFENAPTTHASPSKDTRKERRNKKVQTSKSRLQNKGTPSSSGETTNNSNSEEMATAVDSDGPTAVVRSDEELEVDGVPVAAGDTYLFCEGFCRFGEEDLFLCLDSKADGMATIYNAMVQQVSERAPVSPSKLPLAVDAPFPREEFLTLQGIDGYLRAYMGEIRYLALSEEGLPRVEKSKKRKHITVKTTNADGEEVEQVVSVSETETAASSLVAESAGTHLTQASSQKSKGPVNLRLTLRQQVKSRWIENYPTPKNKRPKRMPVFNSLEAHHESGALSPLHLCVRAGSVSGTIAILNHQFEFAYRRMLVYLAPNLLVLAAQSGSWDTCKFLLESDLKPAWQFEKIWNAVLQRAQHEAAVRQYPQVCRLLKPFPRLPDRTLEYRCYVYGFPVGVDPNQFRDWLDERLEDLRPRESDAVPEYHCGIMQDHLVNARKKSTFWVSTQEWETFCNVLDVHGETYTYQKPITYLWERKVPHLVAKEALAQSTHRPHMISVMACYHSEFISQYLAAVQRIRLDGESPRRKRGVSPTGKQRRLRALGPYLGGEQVRSEDY
ncbi:unnamed protein product [Amoebophrya sp. A25]|nr:unnamed protein product [Amoebophrya sp. A25]|eukprot:GSA25T00006220001.1